jgi:hypothetical protein
MPLYLVMDRDGVTRYASGEHLTELRAEIQALVAAKAMECG